MKREKEEKERKYQKVKERDQENRYEKYQSIMTKEQFTLLEQWSELSFDELIFDSKVHDWKNKTTFEETMKGRRRFVILIETKKSK